MPNPAHASSPSVVLTVDSLGFPFETEDPFLFCAHHLDRYPRGAADLGPEASLAGRPMGMDFSRKDGWSMYHGQRVPGFPQHPHRGFETITVALQGSIDHSDSLGAAARFSAGDAQWMTAGRGIVHSEMFPLLRNDDENPTELFQVWLNLPREEKMVQPYFTMMWKESIPEHRFTNGHNKTVSVLTVAGPLGDEPVPSPPPNSWAAKEDSHVALWNLRFEAGSSWTLPPVPPGVRRSLYFHQGSRLAVGGRDADAERVVSAGVRIRLAEQTPVHLQAQEGPAQVLLLQGRPILEPVAQHGPFVMNDRQELMQAFSDFQRTGFGGWPWDRADPVHSKELKRFARYPDGRMEVKG